MNLEYISEVISAAPIVGFSGSRELVPGQLAAIEWAIAQINSPVLAVVGCQRGVDAAVRDRINAKVFYATNYAYAGSSGMYAARSIACVKATTHGVWVSFPGSHCPAGLRPSSTASRCFSGKGSGTWASLAYAIGLSIPSIIWLPSGVDCPWNSDRIGQWAIAIPPKQLSLF